MTKIKFLRRSVFRYSKLGLRRKKKQVWRSPKGRDNKMREKRKGYPATVSIGYGSDKKTRGKIENNTPFLIYNVQDLEKAKKENIILIGKIGKKKKEEIAKKAKEKNIPIYNMNIKKFLKKVNREQELKKKKNEKEKNKSETKKEKTIPKTKEEIK